MSRLKERKPASTWYFLAMTHQRLGHQDEARKWYEKAAAWTSEVLAPASEDGTTKPSVKWDDRLKLELLQREVSKQLAIPVVKAEGLSSP